MDYGQNVHDRSIGEVLRELFQDGSRLIKDEIALAKAEMKQNVSRIGRDSVGIAVGGVLAFVGLQALVAAAILVLALVLSAWASALIVGGVLVLIGVIVLMASLNSLKENDIVPRQTMESLQEDARVIKEKFA